MECFEDIEPLHSILIGERIRVTRWHGSGNQSGFQSNTIYWTGGCTVLETQATNPAPVHFLGAEPIMHSSEIPELRQAGVEGLIEAVNGIPPLRGAGIAVAEVSGRRGQSEIGTVTCWNCSRKITENYACRCGK